MLGLKSRPSIEQRRRPIIMFHDLVGSKRHTMLGLKSRPSIKQRRRPIIMFRDIVCSKKTHNVMP